MSAPDPAPAEEIDAGLEDAAEKVRVLIAEIARKPMSLRSATEIDALRAGLIAIGELVADRQTAYLERRKKSLASTEPIV